MNVSLKDKMSLARGIAWVAILFSLVVSAMLITNYLQLQSVDPLESPALQTLVDRLHDNPDDEVLKEDIRALDLLIRKAYFTSQWQIRTGAYMLIFGILVFVLAIRYQKSLKSGLEELESIEKDPFLDKQLARKWVVYSGAGVLALALISGFLSNNILNEYQPEIQEVNSQADSVVEVVAAQPIADTQDQEHSASTVAENEITETETSLPLTETESVSEETSAIVTPARSVAVVNSTQLARENYPFFRGPNGTGLSYKTNVPEKWDLASGDNILWKSEISKSGYSTPIAWGNKIFLTGADNEARVVYCYDKDSGNLLWEVKADQIAGSPTSMPRVTEDTGLAAPTMATNGTAVFALFGTGDLISLDMNGNRLWAKNLGVPNNHYGHSSSLIIYKNKVIIQYDTSRNAKVMALSIADGSSVWETARDVQVAWSSPILVNTGSRDELILTADPYVTGYDPETGTELWRVDCMMGEVGPSAAYADGIVYAANEYAVLAAIKMGDQPEIIWENDEYLPEASSPLAADGLVIVATSYGVVACYDALTGEKYWEQEFDEVIYASPTYADGKVYLMDMSGALHVFSMTKEYQLVAESELGENSVCAPIFIDGKMYIRGYDNLYCIGK